MRRSLENRLNDLTYAPEIAQAMLMRQQALALIDARKDHARSRNMAAAQLRLMDADAGATTGLVESSRRRPFPAVACGYLRASSIDRM